MRIQVGLLVIVNDVRGIFRVARMLTEEPSVSDGSIPAAVGQRHHRGNGFFLGASQRRRTKCGIGAQVLHRCHQVRVMDIHLMTAGTAASVSRIQDICSLPGAFEAAGTRSGGGQRLAHYGHLVLSSAQHHVAEPGYHLEPQFVAVNVG